MRKYNINTIICSVIACIVALGGALLGFHLKSQTVYATTTPVTVSTLEELQTALATADENSEIIITQQINITSNVTLNGHGALVRAEHPYIAEDGVVRDGVYSEYNIFRITSGTSATMQNMTIWGGKDTSGAIYNKGTLTMENVTVTRSYRGIYNEEGKMTLKNCNIVRNICNYAGGILCYGGTLIMDGCSLSENYNDGLELKGGGAMEIKNGGHLYANNTVIINNSSSEIGGAINCYNAHIWLANCTVAGNVTTNSHAYCGGGIGLNHENSTFYAVNSIFDDNYNIYGETVVRSDIGFFMSIAENTFINCVYGATIKQYNSTVVSFTDCKQDQTSTFAARYRNDGVLIRNDAVTVDFTHPASKTKIANTPALYVPIKATGNASSGGIKTYFDYSDTDNIKMGYGEPDSITSLGGLTAPDSTAKVTTYYEGGTRADGVIGASQVTDTNYHTVTLSAGFTNGSVLGATIYGDTYLHGTEITIQAVADEGYVLQHWLVTTASDTLTINNNPYTLTVTEDVTLTPVFVTEAEYIPPAEPEPEPEPEPVPEPDPVPEPEPAPEPVPETQPEPTQPTEQNFPTWIIILTAALLIIVIIIIILIESKRKKSKETK